MRYILLPEEKISRRLAFYLAVEEVVARRYPGVDAFFAWRVSPTVIVGRNQLIDKEVDYTFCRANGIDLVRRKSGGGAVFADEGDLMFSYILTAPDTVEAFRDAMERTAGVLQAAGVGASLSGRNDVMVDGKKVSGAALYRIGDRCIVHNTLLFQTDLDLLERVLTPPAEKLAGKGVASVREHVMNIGPRTGMDIDGFLRFTRQRLCGDETLTLTSDDILEAERIAALLGSKAFVFGHNPRHTRVRKAWIPGVGSFEAYLEIKGEKILDINLMGDFFVLGELDTDLLGKLRGLPYRRDAVTAVLRSIPIEKIIRGLSADDFLDLLLDGES